ncbi:MAG TPA: Mrp/NBP35 family ATP-binding protein [Acidimicrobiales bacterium]|nr:Mrp/NBP35 family ATP-binding protein [Acidimicrobiales bacterium]
MTDRTPPPAVASVRAALLGVIDPELGDNIVDLGMVRDVAVADDGQVDVEVALTIAGCPLRTQLRADVEGRVGSLPGVTAVRVTLGEMTPAERGALMDRARHKAQEDRAVATDIPPVARVLAVSSGKGGVGKSSVTVNLAVALARRGLTIGLLDADIWGFSVPRMLGMTGELRANEARKIVPLELPVGEGRLKVVSMGFLADEDTAIMWRGLILNRAVQQFLEDVRWGEIDYLLIDMPPGTGDVQMGLARMLPRTEVLVVTTPPLAAQKVASRAADMARKGHLRVAGVIENMSTFTCDHGTRYALFGEGGGSRLAAEIGVPLVGSVPLHPDMAAAGDSGDPVALGTGPLADAFDALATAIVDDVAPVVETAGCTARMLEKVELALTPPAERATPPR